MKSHLITAVISAATTLGLIQVVPSRIAELEVDRLIVRDELVVSDTGQPWEEGYSEQMVARGMYARGGGPGRSGLWVRGRLIQSEVDKVNKNFARVETIKKFRLIDILLTTDDDEITPTMKLKRAFVSKKFAPLIDEMY